ncbi:MAG TPA: ATP-dependent helicase [Candidatus Limnocylindria bacterium]|nr:ATP-dependent helicase [Candidatus Limnocylindria bacterium]
MTTAASVLDTVLGALDAEQRAAATLPDGPAQIIAPAGSGKTTTMVARLAVLLARGVAPDRICVVTFNRDAALDLRARVEGRLAGAVPAAARIEIRTLHALARQVLLDAGESRTIVADRLPLLRAARRRVAEQGEAGRLVPEPAALDTILSAWKIEGRPPPEDAVPVLAAFAELLRVRGAVDFDDLVAGAADRLETDPRLRLRWQHRFTHVCVDEFQDVDAAQLRLVRLLAAPEDNLFVVGDDDQTIYAWRLADVRRILRFGQDYPAARRVMLATNYRCPVAVVEGSARLVAHNRERFAKPIRAPAGSSLDASAIAAWSTAHPSSTEVLARFAARERDEGRSICFLARTRAELGPIQLALVRAGVPHATAIPALVETEPVVALTDDARRTAVADGQHPFHVLRRLRAARGWVRGHPAGDRLSDEDHAALDALLGWAAAFGTASTLLAAYDRARERIARLRDPGSPVELATVHAAKGREWETVVLIGFEADRMPNRRSIDEAADPARAMEEERRLAYVATTRATRRLVLAFDPARPSPFLAEMGLAASMGHTARSTIPMRRGPPAT